MLGPSLLRARAVLAPRRLSKTEGEADRNKLPYNLISIFWYFNAC